MCRVCKFKYQISPIFIHTLLLQGTHVAQDHGDQVNRASLAVESRASQAQREEKDLRVRVAHQDIGQESPRLYCFII